PLGAFELEGFRYDANGQNAQFARGLRMRQAEEGVDALQKMVDTLIIIPNQNLFRLANEKTTFTEAFSMADDVLHQGVKGVTDLMVRPGLINLDFADVRAVMDEMGKAMMGTGEADGDDRAVQAAEKAIANPLLDEISLKGAKGVLINITGGDDLTLFELDEAANRIREEVDPDANIIVGSTMETEMAGRMRVSVVATGIDANVAAATPPVRSTPVEAVAPAPQPAPVPQPEFAPVEAQASAPQHEEPSLLERMEPQPQPMADDGLPPPAYQPAPQPAQATRPAPGTPTPEAIARLERLTGRRPGAMASRTPGNARYDSPPPAAAPEAERPRFGINTLINRMSGSAADPVRQQPPMSRDPQPQDVSEDQERIEIPAFLRRQAN
ncbi:MAG: cell division protein FtsZ, partial [Pseudomonadota bacterium]